MRMASGSAKNRGEGIGATVDQHVLVQSRRSECSALTSWLHFGEIYETKESAYV